MVIKWHTHAGGTGTTKHGYVAATKFGEYHISPISSRYGVPIGYIVYFVNTKGALSGGLWQQIGKYVSSPNKAKSLVNRHWAKYLSKK